MSCDLNRFLEAQEGTYEIALAEIRRGRKERHWIWYIFPQIQGLGHSRECHIYGIYGLEEAKAYLQEPVLRARLLEITQALLEHRGRDISAILPPPDDRKLRSCMTLFACADPDEPLFQDVLDAFYGGIPDRLTLRMLNLPRSSLQ